MNPTRRKLSNIKSDMIRRCHNENRRDYKYYGMLGIKVCDEWRYSLDNFVEWSLDNGYKDGLSIDRIDTNGDYEPSNCRWTTKTVQSRNTKMRKDNTSGFRGVSYRKDTGKFRVLIAMNGKSISIGNVDTAVEGAVLYNRYVLENNLEHTLNDLPEGEEPKKTTGASKANTKTSNNAW